MPLERYRSVLRAPGVPRLLAVGFISRGPVIAVGVVITLHVVLSLGLSYGRAGLAATVLTVATAVGAPWRGRVIDQRGLRVALLPCLVLGGGVWLVAPFVGYGALLVLSVVGGVYGLPAFGVVRQALSVAVGEESRRSALSLDSISVELSFMTGPAIAVWAATTWSTRGVLLAVGVAQIVAAVALWWLNPATRSVESGGAAPVPGAQPSDGPARSGRARHRRVARRPIGTWWPGWPAALRLGAGRGRRAEDARSGRPHWWNPALVAVFATGMGAALVLSGSEVAVVAQLRALGHLSFTGAVFVVWGVTSIIGGFAYGAVHRELPPWLVLLGLGALTLPIGLAHSPLGVAALVGVAGLFCAPALTATSAAVTRLAPEESRGEALGWQATAMTFGSGLGAPLAGFASDRGGASYGYLASGLVAVAIALVAGALLVRRGRAASARSAASAASAASKAMEAPAAPIERNTESRPMADTLVD